jgi:negative regulator of replication initiation
MGEEMVSDMAWETLIKRLNERVHDLMNSTQFASEAGAVNRDLLAHLEALERNVENPDAA